MLSIKRLNNYLNADTVPRPLTGLIEYEVKPLTLKEGTPCKVN